MKLSNFSIVSRKVDRFNNEEVYADVDVTTKKWFRSTTVRRTIHQPLHSVNWRFVDDGTFTPDYQAETLYAAFKAQRGLAEVMRAKFDGLQP